MIFLLCAPTSCYGFGSISPSIKSTSRSKYAVETKTSSSQLQLTENDFIATGLGYIVGAGSFVLYTPIAVRIVRQGSAEGLVLLTWWLKVAAYGCTDIYNISNDYPVSTYIEALVVSVEVIAILLLVAIYQKKVNLQFFFGAVSLTTAIIWGLTAAPPEAIALAQGSSTILNIGALLPQIKQNADRRSSGGFSPITASLACVGCGIRLFTVVTLSNSDPLLLAGFASALILNAVIFGQIVYYGVVRDEGSLTSVLSADFFLAAPREREVSSDKD